MKAVCPLCGENRGKTYPVVTQDTEKRRLEARLCAGCGLVYLEDWPADRTKVYDVGYAAWGAAGQEHESEIAASKRVTFADQLRVLRRVAGKTGRKLLDVGTGMGYLLDEAARLGYDVHGLDISEYAVAKASERHPGKIRRGRLEEAGLPANEYDVVTMTDLIEHVSDPTTLVKEAVRVLKPGGVLMILTPDFLGVSRRLLGPQWFQYKWEHVIYWSRESLPRFLERNGLKVVAVRHNRKTFRLSYYEYYFRRYSLLGPIGTVVGRVLSWLPESVKKLSFPNPVTGEVLVVARKKQ
ncbi:MAG: class I SAM-dependent methyltransferase [Patescibacteria group bacterium]|nr:class I SAM-dependent methyltransferase [Patescibacteria group bacterium]